MSNKITAFEYLITSSLKWKSKVIGCPLEKARLSRTQTLKLLFLASAIPTKEGYDLLDVFNHFYAMQFGPVESDILDALNTGSLINLKTEDMYLTAPSSTISLDEITKHRIDDSMDNLRNLNINLVTYSATQLVELTHKWWCWKQAYQNAQLLGKGSYAMSSQSIRQSNRVFSL